MTEKKKLTHVCSGCIDEFLPKDLFIATKPGSNYTTYYCGDCINKLGIQDSKPYLKPRAKKEKKSK